MLLTLAVFAQLAAACAPQVAVGTLAPVARTESGFNTLAIHDNTTGSDYAPATPRQALALYAELAGHSLDLGLMQINTANLRSLGLTPAAAFDACRSLAAAARLLRAAYLQAHPIAADQRALREALSRYNTGSPTLGFANGYVRRVANAARVLRVQ